jgi:hypothetical protein
MYSHLGPTPIAVGGVPVDGLGFGGVIGFGAGLGGVNPVPVLSCAPIGVGLPDVALVAGLGMLGGVVIVVFGLSLGVGLTGLAGKLTLLKISRIALRVCTPAIPSTCNP